jgi:signal transduction histidine kinase
LLDLAIVVAGLLTVVLLLVATRLTSTTLDRNSAWERSVAGIKSSVALSNVWLQEAVAGDRTIDVATQVYGPLDAARSRCLALRQAAVGEAAGATLTRLCSGLRDFRRLTVRRWQTRRSIRAGGPRDQAYDAAFSATTHLADEAAHALRLRIARNRTTLNRINVGLVLGVLLLFGGMTFVVRRRAKQLAGHNERLRRLDVLKDNFIASVSHELRTPLTSTLGFLRTLERVDVGEAQRRELIEIARVQAERLAELVEDLLFFAEADTGKLRLLYEDVDLAALLEECRRATEPLAEERGLSLEFAAERTPRVRADRARLAQVLENLVSNAVKFTEPGGRVEVRATGAAGHARLEVSDTGIGIPATEQPYLFDRFFRSSTVLERAIPGTGLGLSIVKAIVEAHDGALTITSEEARGTTVRVRLPS